MISFLKKIKIKNLSKIKINNFIIYQVINSFMINKRKSTSKQKTRGEVSFSNKKPWKQKGTGSARSGRKSSPLWIKGGCSFSNKNNVYKNKINKKIIMKFRIILMIYLFKKKKVFFLNKSFDFISLKKNKKFLVILDKKEDFKIIKKYKNFSNFVFSDFKNLNVLYLIKYNSIIVKKVYLEKIFNENTKCF